MALVGFPNKHLMISCQDLIFPTVALATESNGQSPVASTIDEFEDGHGEGDGRGFVAAILVRLRS